jgi:Rps23 Pro-64 3,4-dihydroxylase Tpa1-like proline 4-hydroxylase
MSNKIRKGDSVMSKAISTGDNCRHMVKFSKDADGTKMFRAIQHYQNEIDRGERRNEYFVHRTEFIESPRSIVNKNILLFTLTYYIHETESAWLICSFGDYQRMKDDGTIESSCHQADKNLVEKVWMLFSYLATAYSNTDRES